MRVANALYIALDGLPDRRAVVDVDDLDAYPLATPPLARKA